MSSLTESGTRRGDRDAGRAVRRARFAPLLSWLAAAIGVAFATLFVAQAGLFATLVPQEKIVPVSLERPEQITSRNSTLTGFDREQQPYELKAVSGVQDRERPELVHLRTVTGKFLKTTGQAYTLAAETALYDTNRRELDLEGAVTIREAGRFTARMARAHVVVADKKLTSDTGVEVQFAGGTIAARGLQITGDGNNILFLNGVQVRFAGEAAKGDETP